LNKIILFLLLFLFSFTYVSGKFVGTHVVEQDTYTHQSYFFNNYGSDVSINVRSRALNENMRGYILINMSDAPCMQNCTQVNLTIFHHYKTQTNPNLQINFTYCNDTFNEMNLTWQNQGMEVVNCETPYFYSAGTIGTFTDNTTYVYDITNMTSYDNNGIWTLRMMMLPEDSGTVEVVRYNQTETTPINLTYSYIRDVIKNVTLENKTLFDSFSTLDCYAYISLYNQTNTNLVYWWTNSTGNNIRQGTKVCEHKNTCTVDTLPASLTTIHDGYTCHINVSEGGTLYTNSSTQLNKSVVGLCTGSVIYPLVNFTYYNEQTKQAINVSSLYDVTLYDNSGDINVSLSFTDDYYNTICTNLNPADTIQTLALDGEMTLYKTGYDTRVFNIPFENPITISNHPVTNQSLYLLTTDNSTTMAFSWYTLDFIPIDGYMLIYECLPDGTQTLIDAPLITDGVATSNLQLYTTSYSYQVVVSGTTYTDDTYTACHVESTDERTYYVDTSTTSLTPFIDLYDASCSLWQSGADRVKMSWSANDVLTGCIEAYRGTVSGKVKVYESCVNSSAITITRTITNNTLTYYVMGYLTDQTNTAYCDDTIVVTVATDSQSAFGVHGAFGMGLMALAFVLLFSPSGILSAIGIVVALMVGTALSLISIGWPAVILLICFVLAALVVARYRQKQ
jgi:hypothetical protein